MATETEGTFKVGNTNLYTKTWTPMGQVKAKLIFIHGFSDHIGRYYGLFPSLASRGILVYGFDKRGWGRSVVKPSDKGLTGPTSQVIAEVAAFIVDKLPSDVPLFVMGHSMGGGEALILASDPSYEDLVGQVRGWILESPFIGFPPGQEPNALKILVGKLVARLLPRQHLLNPIDPTFLSRDPDVAKSVAEDDLCHDTGTLEGLAGTLERTENLKHGKVKLSPLVKSLLVCHGDCDKVTSFDASRNWFERQKLEDGAYKVYESCYHQLHADLCKEEFYTHIGDWILERSEQKTDTTGAEPPKAEAKL